jgi:hypothetical protein
MRAGECQMLRIVFGDWKMGVAVSDHFLVHGTLFLFEVANEGRSKHPLRKGRQRQEKIIKSFRFRLGHSCEICNRTAKNWTLTT